LKAQDAFDTAIASWSDTRLKAYLDARGVPVPQNGKKDELLAAVRLNAHKAATGWSAWTFDTWTVDNLKAYLASTGDATAKTVSEKAGATREELLAAAQSAYETASKSSGEIYASATSYLSKQTDAAKTSAFETWSESDLKAYADSYGVPVPQGSTKNEIIAYVRNQANWFKYGTTTPQGTLYAKLQNGAQYVWDLLGNSAASGRKSVEKGAEKGADRVKEGVTYATNRAGEAAQKAAHRAKEEL